MDLTVGDEAPDFTLPDQSGSPWSLSEHRGRPVVLYFYPKDDTPGCTNQACDVRDHWTEFTELGAVVAGISPDDVDSHDRFARKHDLPHLLLADADAEVIRTYGAWGTKTMYGRSYEGVIRSSVVVGSDGRIAARFAKIRPADQSRKALETLHILA